MLTETKLILDFKRNNIAFTLMAKRPTS